MISKVIKCYEYIGLGSSELGLKLTNDINVFISLYVFVSAFSMMNPECCCLNNPVYKMEGWKILPVIIIVIIIMQQSSSYRVREDQN